MRTTFNKENTPNPYLINNFKNLGLIHHNPFNRCSAYTIEEGLEQGYLLKECLESITINKALTRSILEKGFIPINVIRLFETKDREYYTLDGDHRIATLKYIEKEYGKTYKLSVLVFPEDESVGFDLEAASIMMREMNQDGATKWSFLDIIRTFDTPRTNAVKNLFSKFGSKVSSVAVIADVVSETATSTKRDSLTKIWADKSLNAWSDSFEYLSTLVNVKVSKAISQPASDAFKVLWNLAKETNCLEIFKTAITSVEIPIGFGSCGRPTKNLWLSQFVNMLTKYKSKDLTPYKRQKYTKFVAMARGKVNYEEITNNLIKTA